MIRLLICLILLVPTLANAEAAMRILTISGSGQVTVAPDLALVSVGVEVGAPTADRALKLNSARMQEVFASLEQAGIARRDIQTSQLSIHPQWDSQQTSYDKPISIKGFIATNVVQVRLRDLGRLGQVLDALTRSGANRIQGVRFDISEPGPHLDRARQLAVADALRKAQLIADAAGVALGAIQTIEASDGGQTFYRAEAARMADGVPVAEGELSLNADVTIRFAIE
ncbi:MAG: SIMPL domain-containing protein [Rhodobacteraceae bacterium]|nr:SIMPL domain-containing protein [Paracoccaceae bacterium]